MSEAMSVYGIMSGSMVVCETHRQLAIAVSLVHLGNPDLSRNSLVGQLFEAFKSEHSGS